jgi:hypothetical protein
VRLALAVPVLALALCPLFSAASPACAQSTLRLNEILAGPGRDWNGDGTFSSRDDEWVELVNTGSAPLDLAGHLLTDADRLPRYALSGTLAPGGRVFVTGKAAYDWERATGHPAFGLSLGNSGDAVMLWKVEGPDTLMVDAYTYRSHEAAVDRAIGHSPDGAEGAWVLFDALNPYTGTTPPAGNGCAPTPAEPNVCGGTPTAPVTWGRVKTLYR